MYMFIYRFTIEITGVSGNNIVHFINRRGRKVLGFFDVDVLGDVGRLSAFIVFPFPPGTLPLSVKHYV